jgi:hypothetical protein
MVLAVLAGGVMIGWTSMVSTRTVPLKNVALTKPTAVSLDEINAARYIRDHSNVNDLVMTNRHCTTPIAAGNNCDSRHFVVAAFSERQMLVEAWTATPESAKLGPNGRDSITVNYWNKDLLDLNDRFIADPNPYDAKALKDDGVKWIYVDHSVAYASPAAFAPFATLRYQNPGVDVYEFTNSGS